MRRSASHRRRCRPAGIDSLSQLRMALAKWRAAQSVPHLFAARPVFSAGLGSAGHYGCFSAPGVNLDMINDRDAQRSQRVLPAMLQMKKIDFEKLKKAYAD